MKFQKYVCSDPKYYLNIVFNGNNHNILTQTHLIDDKKKFIF